ILDLARDGVDDEAGAELEDAGANGDPNDEERVATQVSRRRVAAEAIYRILQDERWNQGNQVGDDDQRDPKQQDREMVQQVLAERLQKRPQNSNLHDCAARSTAAAAREGDAARSS